MERARPGLGPTRGPHFKHNRIAFQKVVILGSGPLSDLVLIHVLMLVDDPKLGW
jgi:hypothetical protein